MPYKTRLEDIGNVKRVQDILNEEEKDGYEYVDAIKVDSMKSIMIFKKKS